MNPTYEGIMRNTPLVVRRLAAAAILAAVALVSTATSATAHASLTDSNPKDGASLAQMPETVSVTLNEPVAEPAYLVVTDASGKALPGDPVSIDDKTVTTQLDSEVAAGEYSLAYRVVSVDGHAVTGKADFTITTSAEPSPSATASVPTATATPDDGVTITSAPDSGGGSSAYIVIAFFFVAMGGLVWMVWAGLKSTSAEDED